MSRDLEFGTALRELRSAQKSAKGVSLYSRHINRPAGRLLAAMAFRIGLTPNQVTVVSAAFSFFAVAMLASVRPSWPLAFSVYLSLAIGFAFDSADGQLARLRGESSAAGEWLDHVVDCAKITALHTAVLISFYRSFDLPGRSWLLLPPAFQLAALLIFFGGLLADKLKPKTVKGATAAPLATPSPMRSVVLLPVDYGVFCAVFLLLGNEHAFLVGYALLFAAHALFLAAFMAKWFRELTAIRPEQGARVD
ncbi:CDP-alcohol phosphatidyltransferase family protein [Streptomyces sp. NPDC007205]|uniref:CDP-alcohol phosphatidyltransferase family protein n=1 Tax=Streptomyces sp. NPDC007205 TaxID=3154316 RepID=UPI0033FEE6FB